MTAESSALKSFKSAARAVYFTTGYRARPEGRETLIHSVMQTAPMAAFKVTEYITGSQVELRTDTTAISTLTYQPWNTSLKC